MAIRARSKIRSVRRRVSVDVARRLREFRERASMTQETAAHRAGLTAKYVSQVETGKANPTIGALARLVEHGLGVSLALFFATEAAARSEAQQIVALLEGQPAAVRRLAVKIVRVLVED
jgi:transcriptional regulator with XRE-family HTH domain